ncbi:MAG: hypothetical protein ACEQSE_08805 [Candidatus Aquirickettsiella gammari]
MPKHSVIAHAIAIAFGAAGLNIKNIKNILNAKPFYDSYGWDGYNHSFILFGRVLSVSAS